MIRQTPHQKINYGLFRSLSFGIICFFTLFCIAAAVRNNIFRDSYICAVCMINILALIFADKSNPISFSEELNHIKTCVWLEKLRFPNKLNVEYDISCPAFPVPALSVQPMVENAIKHGICKSRYGGTVRICSL